MSKKRVEIDRKCPFWSNNRPEITTKWSFTLKNQRFSHKKDHLPLISLSSSIFLSIDPLEFPMLALKSSYTPQHHQSLNQKVIKPLETFDSRDFFSTAPLKSLLRSQWWDWSHWIASLCSQWRVWNHWITTLRSQWQRKRIRFLFFIRGKLLKITSIVNFQLISSNP